MLTKELITSILTLTDMSFGATNRGLNPEGISEISCILLDPKRDNALIKADLFVEFGPVIETQFLRSSIALLFIPRKFSTVTLCRNSPIKFTR